MPYEGFVEITFMESVASRRVVYLSTYSASRATMSTLTNEQNGQPKLHVGGVNISTSSTLRAADSANGLYYVVLVQSECSVMGLAGPGRLRYSSNSAQETTVNINFTKHDSADSMRFGAFALPNVAAAAAGGLPTFGTGTGQINLSGGSTGIVPGNLSGVSMEVKSGGIQVASIGKGNYSGVSQEVLTGGIQVASIGAGTYSSVTFDGVNRVNSSVTPANATYSQVTVRIEGVDYSGLTIKGITNYANISSVTLNAGTHSGATIQGLNRLNSNVTLNADTHSGATVGGIAASGIVAGSIAAAALTNAKFAVGAIDALALATDAGQEIADALLGRNIAGGSSTGRVVSEALYVLRNRVAIDGSTVTVYQVDDSTSAWTGAVTTGTNPIAGVDPGGP